MMMPTLHHQPVLAECGTYTIHDKMFLELQDILTLCGGLLALAAMLHWHESC